MRRVLLCMCLAVIVAACGSLDESREVVDTVDEAVSLLQAVENNSAWDTITDGLDDLDSQPGGYTAMVSLRRGVPDGAGNFDGIPDQDFIINLIVDKDGDVLLSVITGEETTDYLLDTADDPAVPPHVYRLTEDQGYCVPGDAERTRWGAGLRGIFAEYDVQARGVRLLAVVVKKDSDDKIVGRDVTRYDLESKLPEALAVLERLDSADLQSLLDQVGVFELSGALYLDQDTQALMRFSSVYEDAGERLEFSFDITGWGEVDDITAPDAAQGTEACAG